MNSIQHQLPSLSVMAGLALTCTMAQAGVVVVVGAKSPVGPLNKTQVADLYLGKARDFPSGGAAVPVIEESGPAKTEFLDKVLGKTEQQARATWSRLIFTGAGTAPKEIPNAAEMKKLLASNPNVIGMIDKTDLDGQVKVVLEP